jgi:murein DD-endopeptidase MepM/ murein hydrolase activator NlpD
MRTRFLVAAMLIVNCAVAGGPPFPLQIEMRVPTAATVFPSAGHRYAVYELYLTNFAGGPQKIRGIEVLDADDAAAKPLATFAGKQLDEVLERGAVRLPDDRSDLHQVDAGVTVVAYMWIPFDADSPVPQRLRHRVLTDDSSGEGAIVSTHGSDLHVLSPPTRGTGWWASDGPSNIPDNHHRRGIWISNGQLTISRRFATDWILEKKGHGSSGNPNDRRSYYGYGQDVYAVGDATVVTAKDGQPENVPGFGENFHPAVPVTLETVGGNTIALNLGGGQYAWYFHLQPGSVRVKAGEHVRRGQPLGKIGCSGDARMPHLHFEVTTSATVLAGEGVPYLIDQYRILTQDKTWEPRTEELPLDGMRVDFGR